MLLGQAGKNANNQTTGDIDRKRTVWKFFLRGEMQEPAAQLVPGYRADESSETDQQDVRQV